MIKGDVMMEVTGGKRYFIFTRAQDQLEWLLRCRYLNYLTTLKYLGSEETHPTRTSLLLWPFYRCPDVRLLPLTRKRIAHASMIDRSDQNKT